MVSIEDEEEPSGVFDVPSAVTSIPAELSGRVVAGRYEILERLGEGGMGQVMRVRHMRLGKAFALKLMHPELSLDPEAERLFHHEARLASHLSHPNIVETIDFGNDPDWGWFIVMEYLDGEPLSTRLEQHGILPLTVALEVAAQLADALAHSHIKQVIHGDLKCENVLCLAPGDAGDPWQVKLLDFGTANKLTSTGSSDRVAGTPEYLAPERITGGPPLPSADIYALGIILYEMLTGKPPFCGGEPMAILQRHLTEAPEPAGARRGEVLDARLDAILDRALAKDPAQRYLSAEAMLEDLRAYLDVLGVRQRAGTLPASSTRSDVDVRIEAASAAFEALRLPAAGLHRDGTIVIANQAFARFVGGKTPADLEGSDVRRTAIAKLNPELQDDLRLVALNGQVVRRVLELPRKETTIRVRYILTPASGPCGHCLLVLHSL